MFPFKTRAPFLPIHGERASKVLYTPSLDPVQQLSLTTNPSLPPSPPLPLSLLLSFVLPPSPGPIPVAITHHRPLPPSLTSSIFYSFSFLLPLPFPRWLLSFIAGTIPIRHQYNSTHPRPGGSRWFHLS